IDSLANDCRAVVFICLTLFLHNVSTFSAPSDGSFSGDKTSVKFTTCALSFVHLLEGSRVSLRSGRRTHAEDVPDAPPPPRSALHEMCGFNKILRAEIHSHKCMRMIRPLYFSIRFLRCGV
uniref:Secreted protein n=1 Tax=Gasterosteus aculeatus TaxID=69293 RepID=G3NZT7_GASAC